MFLYVYGFKADHSVCDNYDTRMWLIPVSLVKFPPSKLAYQLVINNDFNIMK